MSEPQTLVRKLWSYCDVLRDDGLSYGDYVEHLTYLLFLEMTDEQTRPPSTRCLRLPTISVGGDRVSTGGDVRHQHSGCGRMT